MESRLAEPNRFVTLDVLRGIGVMGILLMNISSFAMPEAGYINPMAWGGTDPVNLGIWFANFILIDGKMRMIFSMLFGASMLLVMERAEAQGGNGASVHLRRMAVLLIFGLLHYYLIWEGDILTLYAVTGAVVGTRLWQADIARLRHRFLLMAGAAMLLLGLLCTSFYMVDAMGHAPGARPDQVRAAQSIRDDLGAPGSAKIADALLLQRGSYAAFVHQRTGPDQADPLTDIILFGFETAAFMIAGMILYRTGALTGGWTDAQYWRLCRWGYGIGLAGECLLAWLIWRIGFDAFLCGVASLVLKLPFQFMMALGHIGLAMVLIRRFSGARLVLRIGAAGRAAFSNYLGTSLVMTLIFYGHGLGWAGWVNRWQCMVIVLLAWVLMLAWSKPWLERFHYGPMEWLWRSMARGAWQPLRRVTKFRAPPLVDDTA